jgi:hypothetical protein
LDGSKEVAFALAVPFPHLRTIYDGIYAAE